MRGTGQFCGVYGGGGEVNHAKLTPVDSIGYSAAIIIESHEYNSI